MNIARSMFLAVLIIGSVAGNGVRAAEPAGDKVWITLDEQTFDLLKALSTKVQSHSTYDVANGMTVYGRALQDRVHVVQVNAGLLDDLSIQVHKKEHHCAGYVRHSSLMDAQSYLQAPQTAVAFTRPSYEITHQALVDPMLGQMSAGNIEQTILSLSDFRNRYYDSNYGAQASDWLADQWRAMVAGRSDIQVDQVRRGNDAQASVVLTIEGVELADQVLVLGAHLDSINHSDRNGEPHETALAPGADDDASGVASLTEALRALVANDYRPQRTIKLMAYAGEEAGLLGSSYIAQDFANRGVDVVGVLQLDMTNYQGSAGDIYLIDDYTDSQQNDFLDQLASTYLPALDVRRTDCGYACSDHASWTQQGYPASFPFEASMGGSNPYIHSSQDTFANTGGQATHSLKFARLALAYMVELGDVTADGGGDDGGDGDNGELANGVPETGLSGSQGSETIYTLDVTSGATDLLFALSGGSGDADMYVKFGSAPTTSSYDCRPYVGGNNEQCPFASPQAGTWYVMIRGYSAFANATLEGSYTEGGGDDDDGGDCPAGYTTYTGSLSSGGTVYEPNGTYYQAGGGTHNGTLSGPGGTDFDLYLQKWTGWGWSDVAQSISSGSEESIGYGGSSGYYTWRIEAYSGSGAYTVCLDVPN